MEIDASLGDRLAERADGPPSDPGGKREKRPGLHAGPRSDKK